jgi:hypothetical protein
MSSTPEIDFLILADRAEAVNGKLYMMGGGWDAIGVSSLDQQSQFTAAIALLVPWNATNIEHTCAVRVEDADGTALLKVAITVKTGRPPGLPDGASQRVMAALPINVVFPKPGPHVVVATVGEQEKRVPFHVRRTVTRPAGEGRP